MPVNVGQMESHSVYFLNWANLKKSVCFPFRDPTHEGMGR